MRPHRRNLIFRRGVDSFVGMNHVDSRGNEWKRSIGGEITARTRIRTRRVIPIEIPREFYDRAVNRERSTLVNLRNAVPSKMQLRMPPMLRSMLPVGGRWCRNIRWRKTSSRHGDKLKTAPASAIKEISVRFRSSLELLGTGLNARFHVLGTPCYCGIECHGTSHCVDIVTQNRREHRMSSSVASTEFKMPPCIVNTNVMWKEFPDMIRLLIIPLLLFYYVGKASFRLRDDWQNFFHEIFSMKQYSKKCGIFVQRGSILQNIFIHNGRIYNIYFIIVSSRFPINTL